MVSYSLAEGQPNTASVRHHIFRLFCCLPLSASVYNYASSLPSSFLASAMHCTIVHLPIVIIIHPPIVTIVHLPIVTIIHPPIVFVPLSICVLLAVALQVQQAQGCHCVRRMSQAAELRAIQELRGLCGRRGLSTEQLLAAHKKPRADADEAHGGIHSEVSIASSLLPLAFGIEQISFVYKAHQANRSSMWVAPWGVRRTFQNFPQKQLKLLFPAEKDPPRIGSETVRKHSAKEFKSEIVRHYLILFRFYRDLVARLAREHEQ